MQSVWSHIRYSKRYYTTLSVKPKGNRMSQWYLPTTFSAECYLPEIQYLRYIIYIFTLFTFLFYYEPFKESTKKELFCHIQCDNNVIKLNCDSNCHFLGYNSTNTLSVKKLHNMGNYYFLLLARFTAIEICSGS
jgi:hypothetical protein